MWEKIKELLEYNLTEVLFMIALSLLVLCMESIGFVLTLNLMSTIGMMFILFIWLFMMVSIWENL